MADPMVLHVYLVNDRPGGAEPSRLRIGTAFVNVDRSIRVRLKAIPLNGELIIRGPGRGSTPNPGDACLDTSSFRSGPVGR